MTSGKKPVRMIFTRDIQPDLFEATRQSDQERAEAIATQMSTTDSAPGMRSLDESELRRSSGLRKCGYALAGLSFLSATALGINIFVETVTAEEAPVDPYTHCVEDGIEDASYSAQVGGNDMDEFYQALQGPTCPPQGAVDISMPPKPEPADN